MLEEIWRMQADLNKSVFLIDTENDPNKLNLLFRFAYQIQDELYELYDSMINKDIDNCKIELIDILHFLVSIWQISDFDYKSIKKLPNDYGDNNGINLYEFELLIQRAIQITHKLEKCCLTKWWVKEYKEDNSRIFNYVIFKDKVNPLVLKLTNTIFQLFSEPIINWKDEVLSIYKLKYQKNINRQKNGYSIANKTEDDNLEIIKELQK